MTAGAQERKHGVHLRAFTTLRDVQLRQSTEAELGIYVAEGEKIIRRALEAGHVPHSFLLTPRWHEQLADVLDGIEAPVHLLSEAEIEEITGFHVHRGALGAFERPVRPTPEALLADAHRVVVLEDLVDHTNIGAIIRTVAALGFDGILLSPRCADPLYRRSIKVAMGTVFRLPYARLDDWYAAPTVLRDAGFTTYAMTLADDAVPITEVAADVERLAIVVGGEGHGLSAHWQREADRRVIVPMAEGVDSLNVAASVAIACWELSPRRRPR